MKKLILLCAVVLGFGLLANAQSKKRASPKDSVSVTTKSGVNIKIVYGRPYLKGRDITVLIPAGKVWRTGANEATVFEIDQDVTIGGKQLPAGKYSLYTIPGETTSTLIFNKTWDQWGTKYDESTDFMRVDVSTANSDTPVEQFTIKLDDSGKADLLWGNWVIEFNVEKA